MPNEVFERYKDVHKGERVFLIANGPSLAETNLNLLKDEITIAMNRISLIYDKYTEWRPTYYLFSSTNVKHRIWGRSWTKSVRRAVKEKGTSSFISDKFKKQIDRWGFYRNVNWFSSMSETKPSPEGMVDENCFSTNIIDRIDKTGTTMNLALQLVYHMGFSEVVFVGADLGWTADSGSENDPNHFDERYRADIPNPQKANNQMRNIHSLARKIFADNNKDVKFYNASLKTCLDVYPIIDFEKYVLKNEVVFQEDRLEKAKAFWAGPPQYNLNETAAL